jgi:putative peptidoglycan lipid II flippase
MREMGIALATAISAWINAIVLFIILIFRQTLSLDRQLIRNVIKLLLCSLGVVVFTWYLESFFFAKVHLVDTMTNIFYLLLTIILTVVIYGILIFLLKIIKITDIKNYLKK